MRNQRRYMHRGWLLQRLKKLPDMSPTHDVVRILKISIDTAQRWIHDPYFQQNQVAVKGNAQWLWDKHKLRVWLKAVYFESARVRAENPGGKSAREMLGMPEHYSVRLGRDVIIREEAESD